MVQVIACVDVVERNECLRENVKIRRMRLAESISSMKGVDEDGCAALHPVPYTVKQLISRRISEVADSRVSSISVVGQAEETYSKSM